MTNLPILPKDLRPELHRFLSEQPLLALATSGDKDGRPQVAPLFFVNDDHFNLFWFSDPDSRHSVNLQDWEDASATIYATTWEWAHIKGIQVEGDAVTVTDDDERTQALALYTSKFSFVNERFSEVLEQSILYVLRPRWLRWIDNERHFGYAQEYALKPTR